MHQPGYVLYVFVFVFVTFGAFASPIMDSTVVGRHPKATGPWLWRQPEAASIISDEKAATMSKT